MTGKLKQILIIIFLGSLGSGLWELFLKDLLFNIGNIFVVLFSSLSSGYIDSLYANVGARGDGIIILPATLTLVLMCFTPPILFIISKAQIDKLIALYEEYSNEEVNESLKPIEKNKEATLKKWKRIKVFLLISSVLTSLLYINVSISILSEYKAHNVVERRLEIIRPYIKEQDFYQLKSDFRLINDLHTLQSIIDETEAIAVNSNVEMPEFSLYGVIL